MQIIEVWSHSDTVSGAYIFDDGARAHWSEGRGSAIDLLLPPNEHYRCRHIRFGCDEPMDVVPPEARPYYAVILDTIENGNEATGREMTKSEEREHNRIRNR